MTTIIAELAIYGDNLEPDQVTATLGVELNTTWLRGDIKNRRTKAVYDYGCWKTCTKESADSLEGHMHILIERFAKCNDLIRSFVVGNGFEIEVSVIVKVAEESPDISLSKETVEWISALGSRLDIDMYL